MHHFLPEILPDYLHHPVQANFCPSGLPWQPVLTWKLKGSRHTFCNCLFLCPFCGSAGKESACSVGDLGSIPGLERSPGEGKGYPLQYSGLENSMDSIVHQVTKNWTRLSNFHSLTQIIVTSKVKYNMRGLVECLPCGRKPTNNAMVKFFSPKLSISLLDSSLLGPFSSQTDIKVLKN